MSDHIAAWLAAACADAERRGLPELRPLLESLARSTGALRAADAQLSERERPGPATTDGAASDSSKS